MTGRPPDFPDLDSFEWDSDADAVDEDHTTRSPTSGQTLKNVQAARPPAFTPGRVRERLQHRVDPVFMYLVLIALSVGLTPLAADSAIDRYTILWTLLAIAGVIGVASKGSVVPGRVAINDALWGGAMGILVGLPLLLVGTPLLVETSDRMFVGLPTGAVFQSVVFVMATTETIFFRGLLQEQRSLTITAVMASGWSVLLFFPTLDVIQFPMIALIVGTFVVMLNVLYSYVRQRNGLAAALLCQIVVSVLWLVVPRLFA